MAQKAFEIVVFSVHALVILAIPVWATVRLRLIGLPVSSVLVWLFITLSFGSLIAYTSQQEFNWVLDAFFRIWLVAGWIPSSLYVGFVSVITWLVIDMLQRRKQEAASLSTTPDVTPQPTPLLGGDGIRHFSRLHPVEQVSLALLGAYLLYLTGVTFHSQGWW